jgi:hypothetical protein
MGQAAKWKGSMKPYLIVIAVIVAIATTVSCPTAGYPHDRAGGHAGLPTGFRK